MSAPEPPADSAEPWPPTPRHYWQMRHDVDDVYNLLGKVERKVDALAVTQTEHTVQLSGIRQTLGEHDARFGGIEGQLADIRGQLVEILQAVRPDSATD